MRVFKLLLELVVATASLYAQGGTVIQDFGQPPAVAVPQSTMRGAGTPTQTCSATVNIGMVYTRIDAGAGDDTLYVCAKTGTNAYSWEGPYGGGGGGGVTSVGLALPISIFTVSGSPVTTSGVLTGTLAGQSANTVFAGPTSGSSATPAFRALAAADIPAAAFPTINSSNYGMAGLSTGDLSETTTAMDAACASAGGGKLFYQGGNFTSNQIVLHSNCPKQGSGKGVTNITLNPNQNVAFVVSDVAGYGGTTYVKYAATFASGSNSFTISSGLSDMTLFGNSANQSSCTAAMGGVMAYTALSTFERLIVIGTCGPAFEMDYNPAAGVPTSLTRLGDQENRVYDITTLFAGRDVVTGNILVPNMPGFSLDAYTDNPIAQILSYNNSGVSYRGGPNSAAAILGPFHLFGPSFRNGCATTNMLLEGAFTLGSNIEIEGSGGTCNGVVQSQVVVASVGNIIGWSNVFQPLGENQPSNGIKMGQVAGEIPVPCQAFQTTPGDCTDPITTAATGTIGMSTLTITGSTAGLVNGQYALATGIPLSTTMTISGTTVTLSNNLAAGWVNGNVIFANSVTTSHGAFTDRFTGLISNSWGGSGGLWLDNEQNNNIDMTIDLSDSTPVTTAATGTIGTAALTITGSTAGISNGQYAIATGIPANTTITISGTAVTLSANLTGTWVNGNVTFSGVPGVGNYLSATPQNSDSFHIVGLGDTCPPGSASWLVCGGIQVSSGGQPVLDLLGSTSVRGGTNGILNIGSTYRMTTSTQTIGATGAGINMFDANSRYDGVVYVTPAAGGSTTATLQAGQQDGQQVQICNVATSMTDTITFNVTPATSRIALPNVIAAGDCAAYEWHNGSTLWRHLN